MMNIIKSKKLHKTKRKELESYAKIKQSSQQLKQQSKVKLLEKMDEMDSIVEEATLEFDFNFKETPAKVLLEVKDVSFGYSEDNVLFEDITFALKQGETLGIIREKW